jgi:hypothetical protein
MLTFFFIFLNPAHRDPPNNNKTAYTFVVLPDDDPA